MKLALALIVGAGACDVVFGLPDRPDGSVPVDAGPAIHITGTFQRTAVLTNQQHDVFTMTTQATDDDRPVVTSFGQPIPIVWDRANGTFEFDAPVPYEVGIGPYEWQSRSPMIAIDDVQFARPNAQPATSVTLNISLANAPPSAARWELISTGVWTRTPIALMPSGSVTFDWDAKADFLSLGPRLVSSSAGDSLLLATYVPGGLSDSLVLEESARFPIEMQEGSQDVTFDSMAVAKDGCTHVMPTSKDDLERLRAVYSGTTGSLAGWQIDAVPAADLGVRVPYPLYNRYSEAGDNEAVNPQYGSPYPSYSIVLTQASSAVRMLGDNGLSASTVYQDRIAMGPFPCPVAVTGGMNAALPINPMLAGVPLKNDNLTLGASNAEYAEVTWQTLGDSPDRYYLELFEAPPTGPLVPIRTYMTGEPRARIAKRLLEGGKRYITRISTRSGHPGTIDGDFTRTEYPSWAGVAFTSAFTLVQ